MCDAYMVQGATHQFGYFYSLLDAILSSTYAYRRAITSGDWGTCGTVPQAAWQVTT